MVNDSENQGSSKGIEPALLFLLPFLGYALAYVFELGSFAWAEAPISLISISVAQIVAGCFTLIIPLWSAAIATTASTKRALSRGWKGIASLISIAAVCFGTLIFVGVWQDDVLLIFVAAAALFSISLAIIWRAVLESAFCTTLVSDYPPLVRRIFSVGILSGLALFFGLVAGMVEEHATKYFRVVDVPCGAYSRVYRINGDQMLVLPAFRGPEYSFELWSLSNKGTVRLKRVHRDEYTRRQNMAGPCPR